MPDMEKQFRVTGGEQRERLVMRWMLAGHHSVATARAAYAPFDRLREEDRAQRAAVAAILRRYAGPSFVVVSNNAEGLRARVDSSAWRR